MKTIVGNWCPGPGNKGFSIYDYEEISGVFTFLFHAHNDIAASFISMGMNGHILYATNETDQMTGNIFDNQIIALDASSLEKEIKILDSSPSLGSNPTWICSDDHQKYVLVTHHGGFAHTSTVERRPDGSLTEKLVLDEAHIVLIRLKEDGTFDTPVDACLPRKKGEYYFGQMSRSHSIHKVNGKNLYIVCDKGLDCVITLSIDYTTEKIIFLNQLSVSPHESPRYGTLHTSLPIFYANMEGSTNIYAFSYDEDGNLSIKQILDAFPDKTSNPIMPSDIIISDDGRHLYVGLRGANAIAIINLEEDGTMHFHTLVKNPDGAPNVLRFAPDNRFMFVTNVFEKAITQFRVKKDGSLEYMRTAANDLCPASLFFVHD